jgi:hypothetical protein
MTINIIHNLINGNLTDAKEQAKKYSSWKLMNAADELGYTIVESVAIAGYLKGAISFQDYCNCMEGSNKKNPCFLIH